MTFQPIIPGSGVVAWKFLQRTHEMQFNTFQQSSSVQKDTDYFLKNITTIHSAEGLVANRRLLNVALSAFGLQDDIGNRYFIQKVLQDGTTSDDALANRLADDRYQKLSDAFGFGPGETSTTLDSVAMKKLVSQHRVSAFESAVGDQNDSIRIALFAQRELPELAGKPISDDAKWFKLMSNPPLRKMFETALGLPTAFGKLDIDKQLDTFREKTRRITNETSLDQFLDDGAIEKLTSLFLIRTQLSESIASYSSQANALEILRS